MNRKIGVILSYILMIFEVLSTLLLTPFIIKTLGDIEYGVYKLSASIVAYLLLLDLGIGNSVTRFVSKYRAENNQQKCREFLGITTFFYLIISIVCILVGIVLIVICPTIFAKGLSVQEIRLGQKLLLFTVINAAVTLVTSNFKNTIIAYERFDISRGISIFSIIIRVLLTYFSLKLRFGSIGIVCVNLLITSFSSAFFVWFVIKKLQLSPILKITNIVLIKEVVVYSSFILIQMIATQINSCLDAVLLGMLVKSSAVIITVYGIGQQITQYFQSIGSSINGVLMPGVVKMIENGASSKSLCDEMIRIGRMIFMVLGLIWSVFLVYGKQFIILWVGDNKISAYWIALVFMFIYSFILTEAIGTQILWAKNEHREQSIIKIVIVLLNIVLTVLLIKWNPLFGATIGTAISLFLGDVFVMNYVFVKKIGINLVHYYKGLFNGLLPCLILTIIIGVLFSNILDWNGWIGFFANTLIMIIFDVIFLFVFGFNEYEKKLVCSMFHKKEGN